MNELYAEAGVKRKETVGTLALRILLVFVAIIAFFAVVSIPNTVVLIISTVSIVLIMFLFPRLKVEYEYVFCDGQLDFDKIMGNAKRKNVMKLDFEQVEIMAPVGSHSLDGYTYVKMNVKDFSSKNQDIKPYVIITRVGEIKTKILFEPSEKMINSIKMKSSRKVVEY